MIFGGLTKVYSFIDTENNVEEQQSVPSGFKFDKKTVIGLIGLLLLITAIPIGVYLSQQKQLFKPKAAGLQPLSAPETSFTLYSVSDQYIYQPGYYVSEPRIFVKVKADIEAANLFVAKLKFPANLLEVTKIDTLPTGDGSFIKNWIETTYDNVAGTISVVGGVYAPGFQTKQADSPQNMVQIIFKPKAQGVANIAFDANSEIDSNSNNVNILTTTRGTSFTIIPNPTVTVVPTYGVTPTPTSASNRAFITSTFYNGNLGGLSGADAKCQARADAAKLGGKWKAWLSSDTVAASSRLEKSNNPYKLINGSTIANNWSDLTDGSLAKALNITEFNSTLNVNWVWTNSTSNGSVRQASDNSCNNWSSDSSGGGTGDSSRNDGGWTDFGVSACTYVRPLYCFEQGSITNVTPTPTGIRGDVNSDGKITLVDMSALLSKWGKTGTEAGRADLNADGIVNTFDYSLMIQILIQNGVIKGTSELPANLKR